MPALMAVAHYVFNGRFSHIAFADTVISKAEVDYLWKREEARPLCIHKSPPGFMTRAAAEPGLSVHYHSSIAFCVYDGYPVGEIYPTADIPERFLSWWQDVTPF